MSQKTDVLIIEDDLWLAEQFQRTLNRAGFSSRHVSSGHGAMDAIDEQSPDAIVLDMLLTGGTALTLLHELQSYVDTAEIPVILCTNLASQVTMQDMAPYGVRRIIDKMTMQPDDIVTAARSVTL